MLRCWLARVWREFERGVLGKGRPRVGSRRRDRMPRAVAASGMGYRPAPARDWPVEPRWQPRETRSAHLPHALMFVAVMAAIGVGLFAAATWANQSERGMLSVGLGVTSRTPVPAAAPPTPQPTVTPTQAPVPTPRIYVVQPGDTLAMIAEEHGTSIEALVEVNDDLDDPSLLQIGQELIVPDP